MKKKQIARYAENKPGYNKRKAGKSHAGSGQSIKYRGDKRDWDDEEFISDLGF